jgi:next to BRCA1 gene 1 protein
LDLDIAKLSEKIVLAFNLSPSADFILTYEDVDGDTVMLDDDEDLRDAAIIQMLNPLRINVQLKSPSNAAPAAETKPNAPNTAQSLLDNLNQVGSSLEEALKSSPGVLKTFSTVTEDLAKNIPVPILSELLTAFSKLSVAQGVQPSNVPSGGSSIPVSDTKETTPTPTASKKKMAHFPDKGAMSGLPNTNYCEKEVDDNNGVDKLAASEMQRKGKATMQNTSQKSFCRPKSGPPSPMRHDPHQNVLRKCPFFGQQPGHRPPMLGPHHPSFPIPSFVPFTGPPPPPPPKPQVPDFPSDNVNAPPSDVPPYPSMLFPVGHPFRKGDGYKSMFPAYHAGVACDVCDMTPIVGLRYKSIV